MPGVAAAHPPQPDLSPRRASQQAVRRRLLIRVDLVRATLDVDRDELALVFDFDRRANVALVNRIAAADEFVFLITGPGRGHGYPLALSARPLPVRQRDDFLV